MKKLITLALIVSSIVTSAAVIPQSGDEVQIGDLRFVLVSRQDWAEMTNRVSTCVAAWERINSTEDGRRMLHGKRGHTVITNGEISVTYADGWTRTERIKDDRKKPHTIASKPIEANIPSAVRRIRMERIKAAKPKTMTVTKEVK